MRMADNRLHFKGKLLTQSFHKSQKKRLVFDFDDAKKTPHCCYYCVQILATNITR